MAENFTRQSNSDIDARIAAAKSIEEIRAIASEGIITRERGGEMSGQLIAAQPQTGEPSLPAGPYKYEKEIRWHESLAKRPVIIRANTLERLAELERILTQ